MGLLPFAARDALRNRRRTVSSILGVLLAVTFVAGTFIAIDSSARATLDASLEGIPGDFGFSLNLYGASTVNYTYYTSLLNDLLGTDGVVDASLYRSLPVSQFESPGHPSSPFGSYTTTYAIIPEHLPLILRGLGVAGSLDLPNGTVGITKDLASQLEVGLNDTVTAVYAINETTRYEANLTVSALVDTPRIPTYGGFVIVSQPYYYGSIALVHLRDADWLMTRLNLTSLYGYGVSLTGEIWIDRGQYVNPYDIDATTRNLQRLQRRLQAILGSNGYVFDNILDRIQQFQNRIAVQRITYLLLSTPVILLGVYLGAVGVDLSHAERRRELAVIKTRGARHGQIVGLLILEAVVGGLVAAAIGLAVGIGLSRILLGIVNPGSGPPPAYESFILTPETIMTVAVLSTALMGLVSYRSAKRTAGLPIIETLRYYAPGETKIQYSPRMDIVLVSVGVLDYALVSFRTGGPFTIVSFLIGVIPFLILPFVPVLLIIGLTRLLTRSTPKLYDLFSRAAKPFTKDLYYIIRRNIVRNPRRSSNVAIIIALGLAFGVFTLSILATNNAHMEREIRAQVGADMAVFPLDVQRDLTANLSAVEGVAGVTKVSRFGFITMAFCCASVHAINPDPYFAVAQPESFYFLDGSPIHARDVLATQGQVLVSLSYYNSAYLEIGDLLLLSAQLYDTNGTYLRTIEETVTVGGVVRYLPGIGAGGYEPTIIGSFATLAAFQNASQSVNNRPSVDFLVDLALNADWRAVKSAVLADPNVGSVTVAQEQVDALSSNPFVRAVYSFVAMEIIFIVVILTAGVGLILFAASLERDVEFAAIIVRGASGWKTATLLVGEAFVIMLVGLTIGLGVGLGTAIVATQWLATGPGGVPTSAVPYIFVLPWEALLLIALAPTAILLSAFLVSLRTAHISVPRVLKLRGG